MKTLEGDQFDNVLVSVAACRAHDVAAKNAAGPDSEASHIDRARHHIAISAEYHRKD